MNLHDTDAAEALVHLANRQETDVQQQSESGIGPNSTSLSTSGSLGSPSLATEQQQRRMDSNSQQSGNNNSPGFSQASSPEMAQILVTMTEMMRQNTMLVESMNRNQAGNPFQYNVLPDLSHNIAKFDGLSGAADARVWLKQLESTAMLHRWTEAIAFETARSHLTRAARNWYLANVDTVINWQSFKTAFSNAFLMDKTMTEKWQDMVKRNQGSGEDTREFFFDKVRLCKLLQLDVEETKKQIAIGLWSKETSSAIMSRNHYDIDELLRNIVEIEATEMARKQRIAAQRDYTKSTSTDWRRGGKEQKTATEVSATSQPYTNSNASGSRPVIECYRCKATGHIARNCSVVRETKCFNCQDIGHIARDCTKPRKLPDGEVKFLAPELQNSESKYLKKVKIGNISNIDAMVDTGSSDCTVRASIVLEHEFEFIKNPSILVGFGNKDNEIKSNGIICENLTVDNCLANNVKFRVVPDNVQPYDVIIGRNYTELEHIMYFKLNDKLEFKDRDVFAYKFDSILCPNELAKERPQVVKDVTIPPVSINFVRVKMGNDELYLPIQSQGKDNIRLEQEQEIPSVVLSINGNMKSVEPRLEPVTETDTHLASNLSKNQKSELMNLLNEYRMCAAMKESELGCTNVVKMDIQEKPGSEPVYSRPYKASAEQRNTMQQIVGEWKQAGLVTETNSAYASPCLLVAKEDGTPRLVVDYRRLNKNTVRMNFPLPNLDDGLEELHGATIFAILDLAHGYLQMPLTNEAKEKTAFITPDETGQFERAMFGLMNAPFYFAKLMKKIFGPYGNKLALTYFDDILLYAKSWNELLEKLRQVLKLLKGAGLTLNLRKCKFGVEEVNYLGFVIGKNGIGPGERKVRALLEFPTPHNVHEARRFHGLASFFRRFIHSFAQLATPIIDLLRKERPFEWGKEQEYAFQVIKEKLASKPVLAHYNPQATHTELHTDASAEGLAAMLLQRNEMGELHPVYAISRRTTDVERVYHSSKLELLAIIWAMERLRPFLIGIQFKVITDCQAWIYINSLKTKNPQIVRWLNLISEYDYEIHHRKGEKMKHVDALSRAPVEEAQNIAVVFRVTVHEDEILMYQRKDDELHNKIKILQKPERERTRRERGEIQDYLLQNGILYKCDPLNNNKELYVVPRAMKKALVIKNHDLSSHFAVERTVNKIREFYYFPRMRTYVKRHISACIECLLAKNKAGKQVGELHPIPAGNRPFGIVNIDHLGPFVTSVRGNKYILATICNLTKFVQLWAVKDVKTRTTIRKLEGMLERFGAPVRFITDRGTTFTADRFQEFCKENGIKHTLNSSRHPQANGQVERLNQTIIPALQSNLSDTEGRTWDQELPRLERDINCSMSKTTGRTPVEALYGYLPRLKEGLTRDLTSAIFHNGCEEDKAVFEYAIEHIRMNRLAGQLVLESIIKWVPFETDSIGTTAAVCDLLAEGVAGIIGPRSEYTMPIVGSITARYDIPHIEYSWRSIEESELPSTTINVYPASSSISEAIKQLTAAMSWTQFTAIYETDDGLSRIQEALKLHGPKDNPVTVRQLGEGSDHRPLLKDIASSREPNIILDAESEQITDILRQANQVGLMQNYHTYIIWDLDFPGHSIVENFMNSTVNMTGFGLLTEKRNELKAGLGLQALKVESALLYDAVLLFNLALQSLYMVNAEIDEPLDLIPVPLSCDLEEKYTAGRNLTEAIRSEKRLNETTGPMKIDENGLRQAFDLQVYEFRLDSLIRVGVFNEDGLNITRSDAEREKDIAKKIKTTRYRVTTRLGPPYLIEVTDGSNRGVEIGNKRYEGYSVDLIAAVAEIRNFEYVFELVPDGNYGSYNEVNKSWNGLVKRLQDRQADLAICDLTINHQREGAVDFTMPFMNLGISILFMKPPVQETNLFSFLSPFTNEVWVYVATAYLAVSVMLFLLARIAPAEWDNPHPCNPDPEELENTFNLMNSMWLTIGSLMQQGSDLLPKAPSIRMIAGLWWFFVLIMVSSYTANLAAFLTSGKMGNTISNAEDLAAQTKIKFGALEGGSTSMFFKDSNDSTYQRMWAAMNEAKPSVFTKSNDEGVERVLSGKRAYAFIMESTAIEYHVERNCELQQIGQQLDSKGYGIAMPLNSPHRTLINRAVLTLQEQGKLERLKNKWWKEQNIVKPCEPDETLDDTEQLKLRLENVGGMFLVLGCGCAASFIVGILEFLWNVRKVAVNEKITPWEALVAEFKFAINIWVRTKPVKVAQSASRSSSSAPVAGEIRRGTSVARSIVGSFLRLDMLDKFEKDNTSNNKNGNQKSN